MGERLVVTSASPLKHSESTKMASLKELESHVGHILPLDEAQAHMDDRTGERTQASYMPPAELAALCKWCLHTTTVQSGAITVAWAAASIPRC